MAAGSVLPKVRITSQQHSFFALPQSTDLGVLWEPIQLIDMFHGDRHFKAQPFLSLKRSSDAACC